VEFLAFSNNLDSSSSVKLINFFAISYSRERVVDAINLLYGLRVTLKPLLSSFTAGWLSRATLLAPDFIFEDIQISSGICFSSMYSEVSVFG